MAKTQQNALISVFDKTGIEDFVGGLASLGWNIYASGGTAARLQKTGIAVTDIAELVGGEAILGHRVVTLSREIHAGLMADHTKEQRAELTSLGIPRIDLVCVDMYPLRNAIARADSTEADVVEMTDIGGPAMLRSAAKGRRIVLSRSEQRERVLDWLKAGKPDDANFRRELAAAAEYEAAAYIMESANYLGRDEAFGFAGQRVIAMQVGENRWQKAKGLYAAHGSTDPLALDSFALHEGTEPSYNNYIDIDRLLQTITHIAGVIDKNGANVPAIAVGVKHGNACGAGVDISPSEATKKMLEGDERAIFGGSVMLNFPVDKEIAEILRAYHIDKGRRILDVVVAPDLTEEALDILKRKHGRLRLLTNPALATLDASSIDTSERFRHVRGGLLAQDNYTLLLDLESADLELEYVGKVTDGQRQDMLLAWAIGSTSNSNTIALIKDGKLLGNGVGQQDRVSAAELAVKRAKSAGHDASGAVAYSDSFFPFPDGAERLLEAGVKVILTSRGSIKDQEVFQTVKKAGGSIVTYPDAKARGFFGH